MVRSDWRCYPDVSYLGQLLLWSGQGHEWLFLFVVELMFVQFSYEVELLLCGPVHPYRYWQIQLPPWTTPDVAYSFLFVEQCLQLRHFFGDWTIFLYLSQSGKGNASSSERTHPLTPQLTSTDFCHIPEARSECSWTDDCIFLCKNRLFELLNDEAL